MTTSAIDPRHDLVHAPDPARERWRESYYFHFYDFRHGIGGYSSIGYRPSKGYSGSLHAVYGLELPTLVATEKAKYTDHDDHHDVAGLVYEPLGEPFGPWALRFDGRLNDGGRDPGVPLEAVDGVLSSSSCPSTEVSYDLEFIPDAPAYLYREDPGWDGLFDGHLDEVGRVAGTMTVDGRSYDIDGRAAKDHSWGVRDWARPKGWRWADMLFQEGPELTIWRATFDGTSWIMDGAIYADGVAESVTGFAESIEYAARERADRPAAWDFEIASASHELRGRAEILNVVPLLFGIRDERGEKATMWNDRSVYRCTLDDGRVGIGSAEFQFRVPASGPAPRPLTA
jgi:hypothetical protein